MRTGRVREEAAEFGAASSDSNLVLEYCTYRIPCNTGNGAHESQSVLFENRDIKLMRRRIPVGEEGKAGPG